MTGSPPDGPGRFGPIAGGGPSKLEAERALFREPSGGGFDDVQSYSPVPANIGEYQIVSRLGGGSMADLYIAHKVSSFGFVRRAVIKTVKRARSDYKQLQALLLDEARATACFDHPNLISLFDVGESDQGLYLALEYVEGSDLRRVNAKLRQRKEALPFELACYVVSEVLRGLHHAHTAMSPDGTPLDIVHRDVNPSNVLVSRSGHVKLADFGVVRMRERIQPKTEPGLVKGKYAYLAPEYIAGESCSIQTDIYAAGIMLFELLSGRECFSGNTAYEVMWKIVNKGVPMYRLIREGVPEDLQRIVQRATSMVPERRYHSGQDMANALEAWLMRSGRHATPWVLSVFFNRHELFQGRAIELPAPKERQRSIPAQIPKPTMRAEAASEHKRIEEQLKTSSQARPVDGSLTPAPDLSYEYPGDFEIPILAPDLAPDLAEAATDSAIPRPQQFGGPKHPAASDLRSKTPAPSVQDYRPPSTLGPSDPTPRPPVVSTSSPDDVVDVPPRTTSRPPLRAPSLSIPDSDTEVDNSRTPPPRLPPRPSEPELAGMMNTPAAIRPTKPDTSDLALSPPGSPAITEDSPRKLSDRSNDSGPNEPILGRRPSATSKKKIPVPETGLLRTGKLEDAPAATVLRRLVDEQASGIVEFRCGLIWKRIFVVEGTPTGITSNMGMELIGEHLVKARKITREALDRALAASERTSKTLTVMLIEQGAIDRETLAEELGRNLAARLQEVLEWRWGTFEYKEDDVPEADILPKLDLDALLTKASENVKETSDPNEVDESADYTPQKKLKEALRVARSISKSTGKGRVERPWRQKP